MDARTKRIVIRVTAKEHTRLKTECAKQGKSIQEACYERIVDVSKRPVHHV